MGQIVGKSHDLSLARLILIYVCRHFSEYDLSKKFRVLKESKLNLGHPSWVTFNHSKSLISIAENNSIQTRGYKVSVNSIQNTDNLSDLGSVGHSVLVTPTRVGL